jgi:hypothetical protein
MNTNESDTDHAAYESLSSNGLQTVMYRQQERRKGHIHDPQSDRKSAKHERQVMKTLQEEQFQQKA